MNIVIVGAGRIGFNLAQKLIQDKHTVTVIEKDKTKCEGVSMSLNAIVINGDGCEPRFLEDAEVGRADVVAAVTADDEDNLVVCQLAKEVFGVRRTVARVNNPKNEHIFTELGVDVPVNATKIIAKIIEEEVSFEDFINLMTFKRGKLALVRVDLSSDSPAPCALASEWSLACSWLAGWFSETLLWPFSSPWSLECSFELELEP